MQTQLNPRTHAFRARHVHTPPLTRLLRSLYIFRELAVHTRLHARSAPARAQPKDAERSVLAYLDTSQLEQVPQHKGALEFGQRLKQEIEEREQHKAEVRLLWVLSVPHDMAQDSESEEEGYGRLDEEGGTLNSKQSYEAVGGDDDYDVDDDQQDSDDGESDWPDSLKQKHSMIRKLPYLVSPTVCSPWVNKAVWERRIQSVLAKWEPRLTPNGRTADRSHYDYLNYNKYLVYDGESGGFTFCSEEAAEQPNKFGMPFLMSSALLLYRLCCLFSGIHIRAAGRTTADHKVVWSAEVKHKATGEALGFSEWKGAAIVRVSNLEAAEQFESDMLELLNLLYHPRFPHPYDGLVAGSIAEEQIT